MFRKKWQAPPSPEDTKTKLAIPVLKYCKKDLNSGYMPSSPSLVVQPPHVLLAVHNILCSETNPKWWSSSMCVWVCASIYTSNCLTAFSSICSLSHSSEYLTASVTLPLHTKANSFSSTWRIRHNSLAQTAVEQTPSKTQDTILP